ncbi:MAG: hypothetical protein V1745_04830, partial [Patescibacteria group bacterium]
MRSFFLRVCALLVVVPLVITNAPVALADDGPVISVIGSAEPIEESVIRMDKELVEFTVPASDNDLPKGKATFWFSNSTDQDVTVPTIFPMTYEGPGARFQTSYAQNVKAFLNDVQLPGEVSYKPYPVRDASDELESKESLGYTFTFTVPAKRTVQIVVTFDVPLSGVAMPFFTYYFGSGAGWSGTIGEARFVVRYPHVLQDGWVEANTTASNKT